MIPAGYTYETFIDFIQQEVFFEDRVTLGLEDYVREAAATTESMVFINNGTGLITDGAFDILPSPFNLEYLEEFTLENGVVLKAWDSSGLNGRYSATSMATPTYQAVFYGDTKIQVTVVSNPDNLHWSEQLKYTRPKDEANTRVLNPIFNRILNDTLKEMGLTDIAQVNPTNIYLFRQHAIVAALRVATEGVTSVYPVIAVDGTSQTGGTLAPQVQFVYETEKSRLDNILSFLQPESATRINVPRESESSNSGIKVVW